MVAFSRSPPYHQGMDAMRQDGIVPLQARAAEAATLLRLLANENRLLLLCHMAGQGEITVGELTLAVGLSQSAVSQHLAMLREGGLVATRRAAQSIHYRLA